MCDDGYYGPNCIEKCHCLNDVACDKDTGECPQQQCSAGYEAKSEQSFCSGNDYRIYDV